MFCWLLDYMPPATLDPPSFRGLPAPSIVTVAYFSRVSHLLQNILKALIMSSELAYKMLLYVFLELILSIQNLFSVTLSLKFTTHCILVSILFFFFASKSLSYFVIPQNTGKWNLNYDKIGPQYTRWHKNFYKLLVCNCCWS